MGLGQFLKNTKRVNDHAFLGWVKGSYTSMQFKGLYLENKNHYILFTNSGPDETINADDLVSIKQVDRPDFIDPADSVIYLEFSFSNGKSFVLVKIWSDDPKLQNQSKENLTELLKLVLGQEIQWK